MSEYFNNLFVYHIVSRQAMRHVNHLTLFALLIEKIRKHVKAITIANSFYLFSYIKGNVYCFDHC